MSYAYLLVLTTADYQPLNIYTLMRVQKTYPQMNIAVEQENLKRFSFGIILPLMKRARLLLPHLSANSSSSQFIFDKTECMVFLSEI